MPVSKTEQLWTDKAEAQLLGRTALTVRYLTAEEAREMMIGRRPLAIFFDDGSYLFPMADDEGNDGGSLFTSNEDEPILPVIGYY